MTSLPNLSRRRALQIVASTLGAALLPGAVTRSFAAESQAQWRGIVMNAPASLALYCDDHRRAEQALARAIAEARRLERIFSLYDPASEVSRLNARGQLKAPAPELLRLLSEAHAISVATAGAFDVTVQPLWQLNAQHFARNPGDALGPPERAREAACKLVDYRAIALAPDEIAFHRADMALSLNGIAQGFVTDRVTDLLRDAGFATMMVDLGEPRMTGRSPKGPDWEVGISDPVAAGKVLRRISLAEGAVATSQGAGTTFEASGRFHHLFDPRNGLSAKHYLSLTVIAPTATLADGLSTGLSIVAPEHIAGILQAFPAADVLAQKRDGSFIAVTV